MATPIVVGSGTLRKPNRVSSEKKQQQHRASMASARKAMENQTPTFSSRPPRWTDSEVRPF